MNPTEYEYLFSVAAIRERAEQVFQLALKDQTHFRLDLKKLENLADFVVKIIKKNYPNGVVPLHSRWRHFVILGKDRAKILESLPDKQARVKAQLDLAVISVLLDAGAGAQWRYQDRDGNFFSRSEGLAAASLDLFFSGAFSLDKSKPWRVDGKALLQLREEQLAEGMQITEQNPLLGLSGRLQLLHRLGQCLVENTDIFHGARPGGLLDYLHSVYGGKISAVDLVKVVLCQFGSIWPGNGDIWEYPGLGYVPFHKLSLWLTLSLIEPLQAGKIEITDIHRLPGLAEYRNGGLFIDGGVLTLKNPALLTKVHQPSDPVIIEWRALTLALLEKLAPLIRSKLGVDETALPLVNILQGGTWEAGRELARQRSAALEPPLRYVSTGAVF